MGAYAQKFGLDAAQADGKRIFEDTLGVPPAGEPFWRLSWFADDARVEQRTKAFVAWRAAADAQTRYKAT